MDGFGIPNLVKVPKSPFFELFPLTFPVAHTAFRTLGLSSNSKAALQTCTSKFGEGKRTVVPNKNQTD